MFRSVKTFLLEDFVLKPLIPINIDHLENELQLHPNRSFVNYLLSSSLHQGHNLRSARNFPAIVSKLSEEIDRRFLLRPFNLSPFPTFCTSLLGLVFGKYSSKLRLLLDRPWPHDKNLNEQRQIIFT